MQEVQDRTDVVSICRISGKETYPVMNNTLNYTGYQLADVNSSISPTAITRPTVPDSPVPSSSHH